MRIGLIGKKLGMTQIFDDEGNVVMPGEEDREVSL